MKTNLEIHYQLLKEVFGIGHLSWDEIHLNFDVKYITKFDDRCYLLGEYLIWKSLVDQLKSTGIPYYQGIDTFLEEYKSLYIDCCEENLST